jgi:hypothetical protein
MEMTFVQLLIEYLEISWPNKKLRREKGTSSKETGKKVGECVSKRECNKSAE